MAINPKREPHFEQTPSTERNKVKGQLMNASSTSFCATEARHVCLCVCMRVCVTRPACKVLCGNARRWGREAKNCWIPPRGAASEQRRMPETFSCLGQAKLQRVFSRVCVCVRTYVQKYRHVRKVNGSKDRHTHTPGHTWGDAGQNFISILSIRNGAVQRSHSSFCSFFISLPLREQNGKGKKQITAELFTN